MRKKMGKNRMLVILALLSILFAVFSVAFAVDSLGSGKDFSPARVVGEGDYKPAAVVGLTVLPKEEGDSDV